MSDELFVLTDIDATLNIISGFAISDVQSISVKLIGNGVIEEFTSAAGNISIGVSTMTLRIGKTRISTPGDYKIRATFTGTDGKLRGMSAEPEYLTFE